MQKFIWFSVAALAFLQGPARAFEPPVFALNEAQLKAFDLYEAERGAKAFAAGTQGQSAFRGGMVSAALAAREALKACDRVGTERCILIDIDGVPVSPALQAAQLSRADATYFAKPLALADLKLDADAWRAVEGLKDKKGHKAFAISLHGPWARAWEAATPEEAERQALEACNKKEKVAGAPCFTLILDDVPVPAARLLAGPDLTVTTKPGP